MGYISIFGRKIAAIVLIIVCSLALAWATRSGKSNKFDTSVKPAQQLATHTNRAPMGGQPVFPAKYNQDKATGKAHTDHRQGALSAFKPHIKQSSRARHSKRAGQGANQTGGQGGSNPGGGQGGANPGTGQGANSKSDATPSPTPEETPSPTTDTILDLSATAATPTP